MIIRVYRCTVVAGMEAAHRKFAFKTGHPSLKAEPGLLAFYAGKPLDDSESRTRCMVQIWESLAALKAARGAHWDQPMKAMPEELRSIYESASVEHFELADEFHAEDR